MRFAITVARVGLSTPRPCHRMPGNMPSGTVPSLRRQPVWARSAIGPLNEEVEPGTDRTDSANRVAALIYTSGTTGLPKGVMLTHRNLLFLADGSAKIRALTPEDRFYGVLPMSHAVGLSVVFLGTLLSGATLYLSPRFDPVAALATLEKDRLTVMLGAPAMFSLLVEYAKLKGLKSLSFRRFESLRPPARRFSPAQISGGEPVWPGAAQRIWCDGMLSYYCSDQG